MENHNMSKSRIYSVWRAMKKRCYRKNDKEYGSYGGRGIKVCDDWKNSFLNFYNWSIKNGYIEETMSNNRNRLTLDRINNDGNYEPSNCRWVTRDKQDKNRANNFIVEFKGKQYTISELSEMCDIDRTTLYERVAYLGWNIEDAMTRPIRKIKGKKKEFMDKYYLIRDKKSGAYLLKGREWTKDVELATRYKSKKLAERSISNSYLMALMDCEVVELTSRAEIFADLEAKLAESKESCILLEGLRKSEAEKKDIAMKRVSELKQQLAEKDKAIENWQTMYQSVMQSSHNGIEEDKRLREQLKEKEKEIEELNDKLEWKSKWLKIADNMVGQSNQDKISFALEQLENCRLNLIKLLNKKLVYLDSSTADEMDDLFDNQIKLLKEGK